MAILLLGVSIIHARTHLRGPSQRVASTRLEVIRNNVHVKAMGELLAGHHFDKLCEGRRNKIENVWFMSVCVR